MTDDLYAAAADDPAARRLLDMIERVDDRLAALDAEEDDQPDADLQAILTGLCTPDDAPLEWRSIGGRVERGTLTWQHFWAHPREEGPAGAALVAAAINASTAGVMLRLQGEEAQLLERAEREEADGEPDRGPRQDGPSGGAGGR